MTSWFMIQIRTSGWKLEWQAAQEKAPLFLFFLCPKQKNYVLKNDFMLKLIYLSYLML